MSAHEPFLRGGEPSAMRQWEAQKISCITDGDLDYNLLTAAGDPCVLLLFQKHLSKVSSRNIPMSIFWKLSYIFNLCITRH